MIRQHTHGIQVGDLGSIPFLDHFGGHVNRGADALAGLFYCSRQAKIQQPQTAIGDQHVGGLDVAVQDAAAVQVGQGFECLQQQFHLLCRGFALPGFQDGLGTRQVVHREIRLLPLVKAIVQHADDVGVAQGGQGLELGDQGDAQ